MKNQTTKRNAPLFYAICCSVLLVNPLSTLHAQEKDKGKVSIKISTEGVEVSKGDKDIVGHQNAKKKGKASISSLVLDFGFLNYIDNTPANAAYDANIYALKNNKSINFNITQMYGASLVRSHLYLVTGLGFNFNNYRYSDYLSYTKLASGTIGSYYNVFTPDTNVLTVAPKKNKLATNYITVPLMLQAKLGQGKKKFVIGAGISAGYLVKGWHKSITAGSKEKKNVGYAYNPYAINAIGEIGINNRIRLYGSYGLTNIHKQPLVHNALAFGLRFGGI